MTIVYRSIRFALQGITTLCLLGAFALTGATLVAVFAPHWWLGDLLSHLRLHYAFGFVLCSFWFVGRKQWPGSLLLLPALWNLSVLAPLYAPASPAALPAVRELTVLHYNLDISAPDHQAAFAYLREQRADILFVQELTPALAERLPYELPEYNVVYTRPLDNTHGSALLLPTTTALRILAAGEVHLPAYSPRPMITATLALENQPFTLLSIQLVRPKDAYTEEIQGNEYTAVAEWIQAERRRTGYPMLVIGDCNTTPWSARFRHFLETSGLHDSSVGFGYQPTWPAYAPGIGIPIDHAIVSPEIVVQEREVGPDLGGDHRPLSVTIALMSPMSP